MEMKVNAGLIKKERESRAWSQQHLASASDLSIRTIQRIERSGLASYESARAIAASFNVPVAEIVVTGAREKATKTGAGRLKRIRVAIAAAIAAGAAVVSMQTVLAEQILMDLGVTQESETDAHEYMSQVLLDDGERIDLQMPDKFSISVQANVLKSGDVFISLKFYEYQNNELELLAEPRLISKDGKQAVVEIGDVVDGTSSVRIVVTPNIQ